MARVLIVDDALFMRRILKDIVERAGHEVVGEAADAVDAIEKYSQLKPDIVTMDIIMPRRGDIDGMGALERIIAVDGTARVIMISALGQQEMVLKALKAGAKDFIVKPFQEENVVAALARVAGEGRGG